MTHPFLPNCIGKCILSVPFNITNLFLILGVTVFDRHWLAAILGPPFLVHSKPGHQTWIDISFKKTTFTFGVVKIGPTESDSHINVQLSYTLNIPKIIKIAIHHVEIRLVRSFVLKSHAFDFPRGSQIGINYAA